MCTIFCLKFTSLNFLRAHTVYVRKLARCNVIINAYSILCYVSAQITLAYFVSARIQCPDGKHLTPDYKVLTALNVIVIG